MTFRRLYYKKLKYRARALRKKGNSFGEIGKKLKISKSTAKIWCHNIKLTPIHKKRLYSKQIAILSKMSQKRSLKRRKEIANIIKSSKAEIKKSFDFETYKLLGAVLYWAEGSKNTHFAFTNSDPFLIKFMVDWTQNVFRVKKTQIGAHLNIYQQQDETEIKKFWSDLIEIPLENFGKSFIKPINKGYKKNTLYYGTIRIRISKGNNFRYKVFGWIEAILKNTKSKVNKIQNKWGHLLTDYKRP